MAEQPATTNVLGLTAQIVSAHVSNNSVSPDALPSLIQEVYKTLTGRQGTGPTGAAAAGGAGEEVGLPPTISSVWKTARSSRC